MLKAIKILFLLTFLFSIISSRLPVDLVKETLKESYAQSREGGMEMDRMEYDKWAERFDNAKKTYKEFRVKSVEEFIKMNKYRESLFADGNITHKFRTKIGQEILCIEIGTQRSINGLGVNKTVVSVGPEILPQGASKQVRETIQVVPHPNFGMDGSMDEDGNVRICPEGSFPRLTPKLEDFYRFETLEDRFRKSPTLSTIDQEAARVNSASGADNEKPLRGEDTSQ